MAVEDERVGVGGARMVGWEVRGRWACPDLLSYFLLLCPALPLLPLLLSPSRHLSCQLACGCRLAIASLAPPRGFAFDVCNTVTHTLLQGRV